MRKVCLEAEDGVNRRDILCLLQDCLDYKLTDILTTD